MIRRIIYIACLLALIGGTGYMYLQYQNDELSSDKGNYIFEAIPNSVGAIFSVENFNNFRKHKAFDSELWKNTEQIPFIYSGLSQLKSLDSLLTNHSEITKQINKASFAASWHKSGPGSIDCLYTFQFNSDKSAKKIISALSAENSIEPIDKKFNGVRFYQCNRLLNHESYLIYKDNFICISTSKILLENSISEMDNSSTLKSDSEFNKILKTSGTSTIGNLFIHLPQMAEMFSVIQNPAYAYSKSLKQFGSWIELDFNIADNNILLNGFGLNLNENDYFSILQNQEPVNLNIYNSIPSSTSSFSSIGISNTERFRKEYKALLHIERKIDAYSDIIHEVVEKTGVNPETVFDNILDKQICMVYRSGISYPDSTDQFLVLKVKSKRNALKEFEKLVKGKQNSISKKRINVDENNSITCYDFPYGKIFDVLYTPLISGENLKKACFIDNFIALGPSNKALQSWTKEILRKQVFEHDDNFTNFSQTLSQSANLLFFTKGVQWKNSLDISINENIRQKHLGESTIWNKFYGIGVQLSAINDRVYHSIQIHHNPNAGNKPKTKWQTKLEANCVSKPVFVLNHYNKEHEICVQDELNNLYLINNSGIIIWKKPLKERIMGSISQIDIYKNGKLQFLFNTKSAIHLIDRNGNYVERYPVKLPSPATAPMSIFDYDKDKNYRIMIASEDKNIRLFTKDGNINTGWKFSGTDNIVRQSPQFFRVNGKDYIVVKDNTRHYILDRRGNIRVKSKSTFAPSEANEFTLDKNGPNGKPCLVTSSNSGIIHYLYFNGAVTQKTLDISVNNNHKFLYTDLDNNGSEEFVFINDKNVLIYDQISGKRIANKSFKHALSGNPNIYNFGAGKIYVGVTDIAGEKIYLLNKSCEMYNGFPLQGRTPFSIGFLTQSDYRFNLIVGGNNGMIMNYKVK